jgi:hypothetical protein
VCSSDLEFREDLALAFLHQAAFYRKQEDFHSAMHIYAQALAILKPLIYQENRSHLMPDLATGKCRYAEVLMLTGKSREARTEVSEGMRLLDSELRKNNNGTLEQFKIWAVQNLKKLLEQSYS